MFGWLNISQVGGEEGFQGGYRSSLKKVVEYMHPRRGVRTDVKATPPVVIHSCSYIIKGSRENQDLSRLYRCQTF